MGIGGKKERDKKKKNSNGESISVQWWKDKENPSLDTDHWPQAWPVGEILPTRGLFFSYRSASCRLSAKQSVEKHCYYKPIQFLMQPEDRPYPSLISGGKKAYNRCLVISLRAPFKEHLTYRVDSKDNIRVYSIWTNIFDLRLPPPPPPPLLRIKLNFKEEVKLLGLGQPLKLLWVRMEKHMFQGGGGLVDGLISQSN